MSGIENLSLKNTESLSKTNQEPNSEAEKKYIVNRRGEYMGAVITPGNRRTFLENYKNDYIKRVENLGEKAENLNIHELTILSEQYAKDEVRREQKHLKSYLKGYKFYTYLKKRHRVLTDELLETRQELDLKYLKKDEEE